MKQIKITLIVIITTISFLVGLYVLKNKLNENVGIQKDIFKTIAISYYNKSFSGIVTEKFIDSSNHNFKKIVLKNSYEDGREVRLDYEWPELYYFVEIGDSIFKKKKSLDMRLKRTELDTMIRLNFSYIKNSEDYIDFLYDLDSIREW